jgi:hypothetical protein
MTPSSLIATTDKCGSRKTTTSGILGMDDADEFGIFDDATEESSGLPFADATSDGDKVLMHVAGESSRAETQTRESLSADEHSHAHDHANHNDNDKKGLVKPVLAIASDDDSAVGASGSGEVVAEQDRPKTPTGDGPLGRKRKDDDAKDHHDAAKDKANETKTTTHDWM